MSVLLAMFSAVAQGMLWAMLALVSVMAAGVVIYRRKKDNMR